MKPHLLLVDDDEEIRTQMRWALRGDFELASAEDRAGALAAFRETRPAVTLLDLGLPPAPNEAEEGLALLADLLAEEPMAKVIIISGQNEKENALRAVGEGAYDFLCKPVDLDELKLLLRRACYVAALEREAHELREVADAEGFEGMIGESPKMRAVFELIGKVANSPAPVLLLGESGTGKEMAAFAIHRRNTRRSGGFVPINCAAIPANLIESELFGHEKGAFTGAHQERKGLIESATGGTLLLDEIGELPGPIQVKLLRFLQDQTFHRVGGRREIKIDTRVIAATNSDLQGAIRRGDFREDLYFRLAVVVLQLPPLREREEDVEALARRFLKKFAAENRRKGMTLGADAIRALRRHDWPGNVRELQNRIQRALLVAEGKRVTAADLELTESSGRGPSASLKEAREKVEREIVALALKRNANQITAAAADLGISRPTLYELMAKLGIERE